MYIEFNLFGYCHRSDLDFDFQSFENIIDPFNQPVALVLRRVINTVTSHAILGAYQKFAGDAVIIKVEGDAMRLTRFVLTLDFR